ncbi:MAG TPA: type II toxin-antitoxin system VapC family toxin [Solirubrobacteraceae bacterium]|nr:type II toxin-antitoxin system VapC family toxin [Solirubrobacteraceae bacterium]
MLDTHAWLWWMSSPERLSDDAAASIADATAIGVSTLSAWEVAMLASRGRISLDRDVSLWVKRALAEERVESLAPGVEIALDAGVLDARGFPGDPADRFIYATARAVDAPLITRDARIRAFAPSTTLW